MTSRFADGLDLRGWLGQVRRDLPGFDGSEVSEQLETLARLRDRLRLQGHLGQMEVADRLDAAETRWRALKHAISTGTDRVSQQVKALADELDELYNGLMN